MNKRISETFKRLPIIGISLALIASMLINMSAAEYTLQLGDNTTVDHLREESRKDYRRILLHA